MRKMPPRNITTAFERSDAALLEREANRRGMPLNALVRSLVEPALQILRPKADDDDPSQMKSPAGA